MMMTGGRGTRNPPINPHTSTIDRCGSGIGIGIGGGMW